MAERLISRAKALALASQKPSAPLKAIIASLEPHTLSAGGESEGRLKLPTLMFNKGAKLLVNLRKPRTFSPRKFITLDEFPDFRNPSPLPALPDELQPEPETQTEKEEGEMLSAWGLYRRNMARYPLLSPEEEVSLAKVYAEGHKPSATQPEKQEAKEAENLLIASNQKLIVSIAGNYIRHGLPVLDMIQDGTMKGLIKALEKYDVNEGCKFSTYAYLWIKQAIRRAVADQSRIIRLPVYMFEEINRLASHTQELRNELGREPTNNELVKRCGWDMDRISKAKQVDHQTVSLSLEDPFDADGEDLTIGEFIQYHNRVIPQTYDAAEQSLLREHLDEALSILTPRERTVLTMRFGMGGNAECTLVEVGERIGLNKKQVFYIQKRALAKIRNSPYGTILQEYLN